MKRMRSKTLLSALSTILLAGGALAEDNLTKLGQFKTTGVTEFTTIAQDAPAANSIRNNLRAIELPPGFTIDLYALVPDARNMAMAPQGTALFVGTKKEKVWVVMDRDGDNIGDEVKDFAPSLTFDIPNGVAFSDDGFLFIAERNRVMMYPAVEFFHESPDNGATWSDISSAVSGTAVTYTDENLTSDATIQMRVTSAANLSGTPATQTITVETTVPEAPTLNDVTGDNLITASEAATGFSITGTGEPAATITLAEPPTLAGGNTAIVQSDGTWSILVKQTDVTAMG